MKTFRTDFSRTELFVKHFDGTDALGQVSRVLKVSEILTDAFNCTYQSLYFLAAPKKTRFNVSTLQTAFQFVTHDLINGLLDAVRTGQPFDWESVEIHEAITDVAYNLESYFEYSSTTVTIFDCFFNHDSMKGESPEEFIELSLLIRNFFVGLLSSALGKNIEAQSEESIIYPNCDQPGPNAEGVYA